MMNLICSNEFTRIRFAPPEKSDVVGVARLVQDVDPSDKNARSSNNQIPAQSQETDWSAAFGFNSAKGKPNGFALIIKRQAA